MNGLLDEMTMAGALLAVERCRSSALGARVRNIAGDITVKEGALAPARETISGCWSRSRGSAEYRSRRPCSHSAAVERLTRFEGLLLTRFPAERDLRAWSRRVFTHCQW
jgi:hypothetical protein